MAVNTHYCKASPKSTTIYTLMSLENHLQSRLMLYEIYYLQRIENQFHNHKENDVSVSIGVKQKLVLY